MDIASRWRVDLNAKDHPVRRVNSEMGLRVVTASGRYGETKRAKEQRIGFSGVH